MLDAAGVYVQALKTLPIGDIDHHESDLYLRMSPQSKEIVKQFKYPLEVSTFIDNIDHVLWYEIPFAYTPW